MALTRPGLTATFSYDLWDRRSTKTLNGTKTAFLYDGDDLVSEITGGNTIATLHGPFIDEPIKRDGLFFVANHQGSTTALTNGSGSVVEQYFYLPFGETVASAGLSNPFQFTGRENDGTGLMYYRSRYYAPEWGRFVSEDPIGLLGGTNPYTYVENDPVNWLDPHGLKRGTGNPFDPTGFSRGLGGGGGLGGGRGFSLGRSGVRPQPTARDLRRLEQARLRRQSQARPKAPRTLDVTNPISRAQLPQRGPIRFIPRQGWRPNQPLQGTAQTGFIDRFGRRWIRGPNHHYPNQINPRTGQRLDFEWDVQPPMGQQTFPHGRSISM